MKTIGEEIKSKFESEQQKLLINLIYTTNWLRNKHVEFLKPYKISPQQYNILRILRGDGGYLDMTTVKERMVEKSPNTTRLSDKLLEKEFIERKRGESDARVVYVKITEKGLKVLKEIDAKKVHPSMERIHQLDDETAERFNEVLDNLRG